MRLLGARWLTTVHPGMKNVARSLSRSSRRRMRSTPTRGPNRRSSRSARLRRAFSGSRKMNPDSAAKSNDNNAGERLPFGHRDRTPALSVRPGRAQPLAGAEHDPRDLDGATVVGHAHAELHGPAGYTRR